jgi:hypothetical protein
MSLSIIDTWSTGDIDIHGNHKFETDGANIL